jgi:hypothetical protein
MSINKEKPHIIVIPEDDANRQIVNGFCQYVNVKTHNIEYHRIAGGWGRVIDKFEREEITKMESYPDRIVILVIDFDTQENRLDYVKEKIPPELENRVFVLGAWSEPEKLKNKLGSYETIGEGLAKDCYEDTTEFWDNELLKHNKSELHRMRLIVRPIIFG